MASVLITGGASGLGAEICVYFAKKGYDIALHYFSGDFDEVVKKILQFNVKCRVYQADLSVENDDLMERVLYDFNDIEILINNASIFCIKKYHELSSDDYNKVMNIHVRNPLFLSNAFAKHQNAKLVINIADSLAKEYQSLMFLHSFSKNCMLEMANYLAKNLAPKVRVNSISPGYILLDKKELILPKYTNLLKKNGTLDEILTTIEYFIKNNYVTGQVINVDGGGFVFDK